jgi:hypothetical protein
MSACKTPILIRKTRTTTSIKEESPAKKTSRDRARFFVALGNR